MKFQRLAAIKRIAEITDYYSMEELHSSDDQELMEILNEEESEHYYQQMIQAQEDKYVKL